MFTVQLEAPQFLVVGRYRSVSGDLSRHGRVGVVQGHPQKETFSSIASDILRISRVSLPG